MSAAMMRRLGLLALVALQGWACGETRLIEGFTEGQTRIRLAPSEFVGAVPCQRDTPGALYAYVVRFREVTLTGADGGFTTSYTSGAVPCDQAALIPAIAGRFYAAEIFGFDNRQVASEVNALRAPWAAVCGRGSWQETDAGVIDPYRPTLAQRGFTVPMRGCTSFFSGTPGSSQLVIDQPSALGTLRCGQGAGEVTAFQARLGTLVVTARCGDPLVLEVPGAERYHTIELTGFGFGADAGPPVDAAAPPSPPVPELPDAGADGGDPLDASLPPVPPSPIAAPAVDGGVSDGGAVAPPLGEARWRTECVGRSLPGATASARCDPLRPLR